MMQLTQLIGNYRLDGHVSGFGSDGKFNLIFTLPQNPESDEKFVFDGKFKWGRSLSHENNALGFYDAGDLQKKNLCKFMALDMRDNNRVAAILAINELLVGQTIGGLSEGDYHSFPSSQMPLYDTYASKDRILELFKKVKEFDNAGTPLRAYLRRE